MSFCSAQVGFRALQHLFKVCIVSNPTCCSDFHELLCFLHEILLFQVFQLTTLVIRGPAIHGGKFLVSLDCVATKEKEVRGVLLCVQDFVRSPQFSEISFLSVSGSTMLSESVVIAHSITTNAVYVPRSVVESANASQVITNLCAC